VPCRPDAGFRRRMPPRRAHDPHLLLTVLVNVPAHVTFLDPLQVKKIAKNSTFYRLTIDVDYVIMVHSFLHSKAPADHVP
jgi:hypothetical protein